MPGKKKLAMYQLIKLHYRILIIMIFILKTIQSEHLYIRKKEREKMRKSFYIVPMKKKERRNRLRNVNKQDVSYQKKKGENRVCSH